MTESPFEITIRDHQRERGGQYVYPSSDFTLCVRHKPTGAYVEVPGHLVRSQHKARQLALEAIEYITGIKP